MAKKYRIGVIGHTGRGNYGHGLDTVWSHLPNCEVVGVADAHTGGLAKAKERLKVEVGFADYRKLLDQQKPDIVAIGPRWLDQHRDIVLACAQRGMHMYMEKPMCRTMVEADQMVAACEKHKVKLAIAFQTRYSPKLHTVKQMIADGQIGDFLEIRARGKEDHRGGGEDFWVLGTHLFNLIQFFAGEPRWCFASILTGGKAITGKEVAPGNEGIGPLAGEQINALYGLDDGVTASFASRKGASGGARRRFGIQICGSKGVIDVVTGYQAPIWYLPDPRWATLASATSKWVPVSSAGPNQPEPIKPTGHHDGNVAACVDLIEAIEEDRQPEASIYEARTSTEMIVAAFASARAGGPVSMPLVSREHPLENWS